ncbi:hypothetical protein [Vibrio phage Va_91-7-154_p41]|nr:hypothetical protein [Vibrio phage Va_91-7-154_p41]
MCPCHICCELHTPRFSCCTQPNIMRPRGGANSLNCQSQAIINSNIVLVAYVIEWHIYMERLEPSVYIVSAAYCSW